MNNPIHRKSRLSISSTDPEKIPEKCQEFLLKRTNAGIAVFIDFLIS